MGLFSAQTATNPGKNIIFLKNVYNNNKKDNFPKIVTITGKRN